LKTIAHTLNHVVKQSETRLSKTVIDGLPSLKSGRPGVKASSVADAVKMVSFIEVQGVKVGMVQRVLLLIPFKYYSLSRSHTTNYNSIRRFK
jgi:hypothetical protein